MAQHRFLDTWPLAWRLPLAIAALVFVSVLLPLLIGPGLATGLVFAALAAALAFFVLRVSLTPVDRLTRSLLRATRGQADSDRFAGSNTEVGRLQRLLAQRADFAAVQAALAEQESERVRESVLAQMAAGLAHEVRNPVAGMSAAVSTLRRYGDDEKVRSDTLDLIERGLGSIDRVAASMLTTYRPPEGNRDLTPADLSDLEMLVRPKVARKAIDLIFESNLAMPFATNADAVRQIVLNLLLNAAEAAPEGGQVRFEARHEPDRLTLEIADNGPGLPDEALMVITSMTAGERPQSRRLGLWLVHRLIDDVNARISIASRADSGTAITIAIPERKSGTVTSHV